MKIFLSFVLFAVLGSFGLSSFANDIAALNAGRIPILPTTNADADLLTRRASIIRMGSFKYVGNDYQKSKSFDVLAATAQFGCGPAEWSAYMAGLSTLPSGSPADGPIEMFTLPPLVRYLYQFGDCMTAQQKQSLLRGLNSKPQYLFGHGTINHAIMRGASWYLLAQYFPKAKWINIDNKIYSSVQLMDEIKRLMANRTWRFYQSGHLELLSPTYTMVNFYPLLNLIDFATDISVKKSAEDEANLELAVLKAHSFHGVIVPPLTRKNFEQKNALDTPEDYVPSITQHLLWYYFGEPRGLGLYDFQSRKEPFYISMAAISGWQPLPAVRDIVSSKTGDYAIKLNTPQFAIWDADAEPEIYGDTFITDDFAVGTGNLLFDPDGYSEHEQTFSILLKSNQPLNQIECFHPYWNSNKGEDAWGTDRSSPFQQMYRYDNSSVVMLFDIPANDPWTYPGNPSYSKRDNHKDDLLKLAECRIPRSFDEVVTLPDMVFVRQGNAFVAMATLRGTNQYNQATSKLLDKYTIVKVREAKTALFFRVDRAGPDLDFAQFQQNVRSMLPKYDSVGSSVMITEKSGIKTKVLFNIHKSGKRWAAIPDVTHDGNNAVLNSKQVIDSPVLSLKAGRLTITPIGSASAVTIDHSVRTSAKSTLKTQ
jgi:hypothetical protein